ncbi:MAG: hypothetical protein IKH57_05035 [Clostridia bacterium]|nr:hypothetical protein [Clostridia bacterium]MBR3106091.1 hypothetical protein [Clostridia bacterium]
MSHSPFFLDACRFPIRESAGRATALPYAHPDDLDACRFFVAAQLSHILRNVKSPPLRRRSFDTGKACLFLFSRIAQQKRPSLSGKDPFDCGKRAIEKNTG